MEARKEKLLNLVVKIYINSAEPVGSRFLVGKGGLDCGEATVRNELHDLEEEGYLTHPHTSAGRIPTEKGYKHYAQAIDLKKIKAAAKERKILGESFAGSAEKEARGKMLAKALAQISAEAVILAFGMDKVYYTGLSNLFNKPDFADLQLVHDVSVVFDRCDECLQNFLENLDEEPMFYIGKENPFGEILGSVAFRFAQDSLLAMVGPMRMDYAKNLGLMSEARELLNSK
jgi:transcriptional regulator of heat shock response